MSLTTEERVSSPVPFGELTARLTGDLHLPGSDAYAVTSMPWNVAVVSTPAAVVEAADTADVITVVRFANEHGLEVAVRATGHGAVDTLGGTILVRTNRLDDLVVDRSGWARVGAGVQWAAVLEAAAPYGLACLAGSAPGVGVVGYLTGGGLGPVARTYGVSADYVRAFEVVTGDGELRRATPTDNPALYWGLRGGKGTLGIVTSVEFDLLPITNLYGGAVFFDGADTERVLRTWAEWCPNLPAGATTSIAICRLPDAPFVPAPLAGKLTVGVRFAWIGHPTEGEEVFAPMLAAAAPIFGGIGVMPYAALGMIHSDPVDPLPSMESSALLRELPTEAIDALLARVGSGVQSPQLIVELRQLGGAISRVPEHASAFSHRDAAFSLLAIGIAAGPMLEATATDGAALEVAMAPWATGGKLPNFAPSTDPVQVAKAYDAETLSRLGTLAATYDPKSVIRAAKPIREALLLPRD